ncbi:hypothetical protein O3U67_14120 [Brevundimonas diminuta]|uniref:hypothetical protein n=1 Tax=Brevundimonas diminuta TaxID=293 RepID=UPI0022AFC43F|nr:hypothetical protein [Brevundimonas diminuta]MCZ4109228.1 hypothetical protein [Brevundimonas diminuta]
MNIRTLISKMEALASPDAEVFFSDDSGHLFPIGGALLDANQGTGGLDLILTQEPVITEGGF